jgi:hypothetical protein
METLWKDERHNGCREMSTSAASSSVFDSQQSDPVFRGQFRLPIRDYGSTDDLQKEFTAFGQS